MLPIESIVFLRDGTSKLMILIRGPIMPSEEVEGKSIMFDYAGCLYPQGLDPNKVFYFNEENIDKVLFEGFQDEDEARFQEVYDNWMEENKTTIKQGILAEALK